MFQQYFGNETDTQTVAATVTLKKTNVKGNWNTVTTATVFQNK